MTEPQRRAWRDHVPQLVLLVVGLAAVLVIRSVVQDDDDGPARADASDVRPSSTTTTTGPEDEPTSTAPVGPTVSSGPLARAALRLEDLPAGWAPAEGSSPILCPGQDPLADVRPRDSHQTTFSGGGTGQFATSVVAQYDDDDRAEELLDAAAEGIEDCGSYESDGGRFRLEPARAPDLGDEAVSARLTGTTEVGPVRGSLSYVRVGRRVVVLVVASVGEQQVDGAVVRGALEAMVDRL